MAKNTKQKRKSRRQALHFSAAAAFAGREIL